MNTPAFTAQVDQALRQGKDDLRGQANAFNLVRATHGDTTALSGVTGYLLEQPHTQVVSMLVAAIVAQADRCAP